jgi:hypothetical protein
MGMDRGLNTYNIAVDDQPVKTFDFYIHTKLNVCIFDKTFSKQSERKAPSVKLIKLFSHDFFTKNRDKKKRNSTIFGFLDQN